MISEASFAADMAAGTTKKVEVDGDLLEITPLGAGCEVGRSCVVMKFRGKTIMFDCGIHPAHTGMSTLPYFDHINPAEVDLLLVTHFHLDHSGSVPYFLNRTEFKGKVYMTHPTRPICKMLWYDYARVSKIASEGQIFTSEEVDKAMPRIELMDFHQEKQFRGIKFKCFGAGHVLGACMFMVDIGGIRVLYTGDYSREVDRHLPQAEIPDERIHVLIVEATYGIQNHEPRDQREHRFTNSVHQIVRQGGKALLPVFALGRAQEILLILEDYWERNSDLHNIPIYYNSPMATKCLRIFETYTNMCSKSVQEQANACNNPWNMKYIRNMPDRRKFFDNEEDLGPCIVLAAPGMLQSGASRELFEKWAPDKNNGIIVTGYSVQGTLAHDLKSEPDQCTLGDGRKVNVRATIKFISFSAHSDYNQTADFIRNLKANVVVLTHGEESEMARMRSKLQEDFTSLTVCNPQNCQTISVNVPSDFSAQAVGSFVDQFVADGAKKRRCEVSGLLVEDEEGTRSLLQPEDLTSFTPLKVCAIEQAHRFAFDLSLPVLIRAIREIYDDVKVEKDGHVVVCGCVQVSLQDRLLSILWKASPLSDMIADSVALSAVELSRNPTATAALRVTEDSSQEEQRVFHVVLAYLRSEYGPCEVDKESQVVTLTVDDAPITVDFPKRSVDCENEALRERIRQSLQRCETALLPVANF